MKIDIFRLVSIDPCGIGNKENGLLNLLYSYFLWKTQLDHYHYIKINQIHQDQNIEEFIEIKKKQVHVNIIHNTKTNFDSLDDVTKNKVRADVVHAGLLRLANEDPKFSKTILENIKNELINKNFAFELEGKVRKNPFDKGMTCKFLIHPQTKHFDYFLLIQKDGRELCRINLYRGKPTTFYVDSFFSNVIWNNKNQLVVEGREKQMKILFNVSTYKLDFQNLTQYSRPPLWEMMKSGISENENRSAYENWIHSLPPAYSAIIHQNEN